MCLPCFPWTWTQYDDPLDSMPEHSTWAYDGNAWALQRIRIRRVRSFNYVPPHVEAVATPARPAHVRFADECTLGATVSGNTTTNTTPQATTGSVSGTAVNAPQAKSEPARDCQPTSFPAVGPPPGSGYAAPAVLPQQWYTSADPTRSLSGPGPYAQYHQYPQYPQYQPHQLATGTGGFAGASYVNGQPVQVQQQQLPATTNMSIPYLAATGPAPPTEGLNFQPPSRTIATAQCSTSTCLVTMPLLALWAVPSTFSLLFIRTLFPARFPSPQLPGQPVMISGQTYYPIAATPAGQPMPAIMQAAPAVAPATLIAGTAAAPVPVPHEVPGLGRTPQEEVLHQVQFAYNNKLFEPQDMKPGDDDPSRFYYVRELDGNWTQRSRYSIDQIPCRWYVTDEGWFYAISESSPNPLNSQKTSL
ncbi:hypothetical protein ACCO45_011669 [Purpureocillium lilacinum]|uniref:Uncharacterized protein n=1 Tax=Purpureocillium lilacinum TaxID=33203 RepID=A0ACC4DC64_PURLI